MEISLVVVWLLGAAILLDADLTNGSFEYSPFRTILWALFWPIVFLAAAVHALFTRDDS